jgi:hypothetical protein
VIFVETIFSDKKASQTLKAFLSLKIFGLKKLSKASEIYFDHFAKFELKEIIKLSQLFFN